MIAFEYVGQLTDEEDENRAGAYGGAEKNGNQSQNVTIVTQPAYAFSQAPNTMGPPPGSF